MLVCCCSSVAKWSGVLSADDLHTLTDKANFPCPAAIKHGHRFPEYIKEVEAKAGDVVIFTETTTQ